MPQLVHNQHVPKDKYRENLTKIVTHPHVVAHEPKILLVTPPPVDQIQLIHFDRAHGHTELTRRTNISEGYSDAAREVAHKVEGVELVDLYRGIYDLAIE